VWTASTHRVGCCWPFIWGHGRWRWPKLSSIRWLCSSRPAASRYFWWQTNPSFVERLNLSLRQHVVAIGRRAAPLCKGEDGMRQQCALSQTYHNFCLPHTSLRQSLPQPKPTNGTGPARKWRQQTPACDAAAGNGFVNPGRALGPPNKKGTKLVCNLRCII
jgi:hypothetical protein